MARTVEDVLSRRTRSLLTNAQASVDVAPQVADLLADELDRDDAWARRQVRAFEDLADGYMLTSPVEATA
jgi:glycerol-3-phosphate dehydrogenase